MQKIRQLSFGLAALMLSSLLLVTPTPEQAAQATGSPISGTISSGDVRSTDCPATPPALVNGGFEEFAEPNTDYETQTYARFSGGGVNQPHKLWHGYGSGPDMHIFFKPGEVPGWQTTDDGFELHRQVLTYTQSHEWRSGGPFTPWGPHDPPRSGVASATTAAQGSGQFDFYSPQPAEGSYWAELNAFNPRALFQDIDVPQGTRFFWSIKHRGRSSNQEQMYVKIGPPGNTVEQTSIQKFVPTNSDKFSGIPTYGTSTLVNEVKGSLADGWNMYSGTDVSPITSGDAPVTLELRFESNTASTAYAAVGNLLDDIQFTAFMACPIVKDVYLGQTDTVDVTDTVTSSDVRRHSYGIDQTLSAVANPTGGALASEFSVTGNSVSFTPTTTGTQTVDYQVSMALGGVEYTAASVITYNVLPSPQLTLDFEDGTTPDQVSDFTHGELLSTVTLPTPSRDGFVFEGWFTAPSGGTLVDSTYAGSTAVTSNLTLYAQWSPIPPQLTLDFQDGVTPDQDSTEVHGSLLSSVTLPTPTRSGYTFNGWFTAPSGGQLVDATYAAATSITADLTLYAQWTQDPPPPAPPAADPDVRLVFGDSVTPDQVVTVSNNAPLSTVALPAANRAGYRFLGWFTAPSGGQLVDASYASTTNVTSNQTLYAQWEIIDPTVTFVFGDAVTPNEVVTIDHNEPLSSVELPTPNRSGYNFLGWYTEPTGGVLVDQTYALATLVSSDIVLFGRWDPPVPLVTFEFGDSVTQNEYVSVPTGQALSPEQLPVPSRPGYTFRGWFTAPTGGELVDEDNVQSIAITENKTLYAQWQIIDPTVTFVFGDGVTPNEVVTIGHGLPLSEAQLPSPTRAGYTFLGWYSAPSGGRLADLSYATTTLVTSDTVLFGRWNPPIPMVTFEFGDGVTPNQYVSVTSGGLLTPDQLPTPSRQGYTFLGWFTSPIAGEQVTKAYLSSTQISVNQTIYARWASIASDSPGAKVTDQEPAGSQGDSPSDPKVLADTGFSLSDWFVASLFMILLGSASLLVTRKVRHQ